MKSLRERKFKLKNIDEKHLKDLGFKYSSLRSDSDTTMYFYIFPVYKYKNKTVLECELNIDINSGQIYLDVKSTYNNEFYPPFYDEKNNKAHSKILSTIHKKIITELKNIDAVEVKNGNNINK